MDNMTTQVIQYVSSYGLQVIGAIIILILGRFGAGLGRKIIRRLLEKARWMWRWSSLLAA
ncbi:MAG: hypothetical protein U5R49_18620 [Deltaproteobacteria bacterium]|nr:hypothetical protein [Deltaproteobacteria bacterium]